MRVFFSFVILNLRNEVFHSVVGPYEFYVKFCVDEELVTISEQINTTGIQTNVRNEGQSIFLTLFFASAAGIDKVEPRWSGQFSFLTHYISFILQPNPSHPISIPISLPLSPLIHPLALSLPSHLYSHLTPSPLSFSL